MVKCPFCSADAVDNECPSCGSLEGVDLDEYAPKEVTSDKSKSAFILLDVDGVLNTTRSRPEALEPSPIALLARVINNAGARVVLSSTWRAHDRLVEKLRQALWLAGAAVEIECTPVTNWERWGEIKGEEACRIRCEEISSWVNHNADRISAWVAVDDLPLSNQDPVFFQGRHVHTDPEEGLTAAHCNDIIRILTER